MVLPFLIEKEFKQMMRNIVLPLIYVLFPLSVINVVPRIATQEIKHINFSMVDNDHSPLSQRLVHKLSASPNFHLVGTYPSYRHAMATIDNADADMIIEIEPEFEKKLITHGMAHVAVATNSVNGMKGSLSTGYVTQILADYSAQLRDEAGLDAGITRTARFNVEPRYLYNTTLDYKLYMIPALMALILILICSFLPALNIVGEKEKGTIEQINVTPISKVEFILSKLIPYIVVGLFLLTFAIFLAWLIHGYWPVGPLWLIYLFAMAFVLVMSSLGLIVSNYSSTTQQAALLIFFLMMIFMHMSGMLTPIASMPQWSQTLTLINPMRYFMEAMRAIYLKPVTFASLQWQFMCLCIMAAVLWIWAIVSYRKNS